MKAIKPIIGRLVAGCVLALGLITSVYGQPVPPDPGDPGDPPTQEELEAWAAAVEAARQALFQAEYQPHLVQPLATPGGQPATLVEIDAAQLTTLATDAGNLKTAQDNATASAETWAATVGIDPWAILDDGTVISIIELNNGIPRFLRTQNAVSADTISTDEVLPGGSTGLNLTGTNTILGIWDGGDVRLTHREFTTNGVRAFDLDGASPIGVALHPTHVAGTLSSYGVSSAARGMSPRSTLYAYDWYSDVGEMGLAASSNLLHISNHSYGSQVGWGALTVGGTAYWAWFGNTTISQTEDYQFGFYSAYTRSVDQTVYNANYYLPVWAAGNERGSSGQAPANQPIGHYAWNGTAFVPVFDVTRPADGDAGGFDTLPPEGVAKNILTIGSVADLVGGYTNASGVTISGFTSFGPTDDGRIKPDLVANGEALLSSSNATDSAYATLSGTSMAAPSVAGSLNLLAERHSQFYGANRAMWASTLKGLAIHTSDEAGDNPGPDFRHGWGLMNTRKAALLIDSNYQSQALAHIKEVVLNNGDYIEFPVVFTNTQPGRVSITYTDPAGTPVAASVDPTNRMLINDLDLRVIAPNGTTNFPWVLDPVSRTNAATTGDNIRDNVERVDILSPTNGTYLVRVTHKGTLVDPNSIASPQRVSILISGNIPQPKPELLAKLDVVSSNAVAVRWPSLVGQLYQVQFKDDLSSTNWTNLGGQLSATKTNTAIVTTLTNVMRFFRVAEVQ